MLKGAEESLVLTPRDKIYSTIVKNPGLHFREIQRRTGIATGAMQYHIDYLKKKHVIVEEKEGKFSRFYSIDSDVKETKLMNLLRQDSVRKIVIFLIQRRHASLNRISKEINLRISTTSFHLQKLIVAGVVAQRDMKGKIYFYLKNKESVLNLIINYKESFLDSVVDSFVELWENELGLNR